ncbi:MAG: hypothetical protein H7067_05425 [Burkholderiales bacterium]|nr:hypothetical protein [Opitutaceae bacterium]
MPTHTSLLAALALALPAVPGFAQSVVSFTSLTPHTENFDDLNTAFPAGTYAANNTGIGGNGTITFGTTFPAITNANVANNPLDPVLIQPGLTWDYATGATDFNTGGSFVRTGLNYSAVNSTRILREDAAATDLAFGGKLAAVATLSGAFTNGTGAAITGWSVNYGIEQYSYGKSTSATTVAFDYSTDGLVYTPLGEVYSFAGDGATANAQTSSIITTLFNQTVSAVVAPGATIYFRWTFTDPSLDGRHVGIDDLVITPSAIPEPSACAAAAGLGALALALLGRRRSAGRGITHQ